ncbi:MFS transporter [Phytomonospora endophytica]|uniref:MFS family permease n=1 Tax=Phytomonospora endophytica TaxID=714109 RepID=A0A841FVI0_9ACTN|nr:MFS transporter [Phytomonospora endophytica]MBB6037347.1 MFS family permease [Phytomonospora endophytica]GIG69910.1 MFS transporter [Phytomonospora endophytica]
MHVLRRDRDFRRFWAGHTVSVMGADITYIALPLVATLLLDAGAAGVATVATATFLPSILLPLLAGHWLEGRRRRGIMIGADLVRAAALAAVPLAYLFDGLSIPLLAAVAFTMGAASTVFDIGAFAYVPTLVDDDDLGQANQAMQGSTTAAQVTGPGLAGLLVQFLGPAVALAVDAVSYLGSALGIAGAKRPEAPPATPAVKAGLFSGLGVVLRNPFLRLMTAHAALYNAGAQILMVNLVVLAVTDRGLGPGWYGVALSGTGAGAFLGTMIALRAAARLGYGRAFATALAFSTGTPLLLAFVPWSGGAFGIALGVLQFAAGFGLGAANVLSVTLRQVVMPKGALARSNGGYRLITFGVLPIGAAVGGVLGEAIGSRWGVGAGTLLMAVSALPMVLGRIRRLRTPADARPAEVVTAA